MLFLGTTGGDGGVTGADGLGIGLAEAEAEGWGMSGDVGTRLQPTIKKANNSPAKTGHFKKEKGKKVPVVGLEPTRERIPTDFESVASAISPHRRISCISLYTIYRDCQRPFF